MSCVEFATSPSGKPLVNKVAIPVPLLARVIVTPPGNASVIDCPAGSAGEIMYLREGSCVTSVFDPSTIFCFVASNAVIVIGNCVIVIAPAT